MRWKIGLVLTALLLLCVSSVSAALSNPVPTSGAYLLGDGAEVFSVDTSVPAMVGRLWIDNAGWTSYPMDCSSGLNCVATPDLTGYADLTAYNFYFVVDGLNLPPFPAVSLFNIDRLPAVPTGLSCVGLTETTLRLDWADNTEVDLTGYDLERNGSIVYTGGASTNDDGGLTTGVTYSYRVRSIDARSQVSGWSAPVACIPTDMTPPAVPTIVLPSPATYTTLTPSVSITYAETVSAKVYSGSVLIANLGSCSACVWNPIFSDDGMYSFNIKAKDLAGNERVTPYAVTIDSTPTTASVEIASTIHLIGGDDPIVVKGSALSTTPNDYWIIRWDLSMYGGTSVRATMQDLISVSQNIDIPTESQPFIFCGEDYNSVAVDWAGTGSTYDVLNTYDEVSPALSCADTDPSGEVAYSVYMKIPVPGGLNSDLFDLTWNFGLY